LSKIAFTLQGKLIGLPAHAGIGLRKKNLGCCTGLGGCGQPEHLSKKWAKGFSKNVWIGTFISQSMLGKRFLKLYPVARGFCFRTASGTQHFDGTLVGAAPSLSS
jgi:hypothetical protein